MSKILEVNHLCKDFGATKVLRDISLSLEKGETLSLIGTSGSGKTTLLRCLVHLEVPTAGQISVNGKSIFDSAYTTVLSESEQQAYRKNFGMVFQNFNLFPQYTALENVTLARLMNANKTGESVATIVQEGLKLLGMMGLADRANFYPQQLSGGQQQRVAIARALSLKPHILCFDEPTSALDPELTGEVLKVIRTLAENHTTMIIVTHEMAFARDVSDRTIFMEKGVIVEEGRSQELFSNPQKDRTKAFLSNYN